MSDGAVPAARIAPESPATPPSPSTGMVFAHFAIDAGIAAILVLLLSIAASVAVIGYYAYRSTLPDGGAPDMTAALAAATPALVAVSIVAMAMAALTTWLLRGRRLLDPRAPMAPLPAFAFAVAAGLGVQLLGHGLSWLADALGRPVEPSNIEPLMAMVRAWPVPAWIAIVLLAPLAEELLFRHVLLRRFAVAGRGVLGIAVTSLLFALIHEPLPGAAGVVTWLVTLSLYLAMGIGFGAVYVATRRFWAAFAAHASCNLAAMLILTFTAS